VSQRAVRLRDGVAAGVPAGRQPEIRRPRLQDSDLCRPVAALAGFPVKEYRLFETDLECAVKREAGGRRPAFVCARRDAVGKRRLAVAVAELEESRASGACPGHPAPCPVAALNCVPLLSRLCGKATLHASANSMAADV
jgi:hypothetical protein